MFYYSVSQVDRGSLINYFYVYDRIPGTLFILFYEAYDLRRRVHINYIRKKVCRAEYTQLRPRLLKTQIFQVDGTNRALETQTTLQGLA